MRQVERSEVVGRDFVLVPSHAPDLLFESRDLLAKGAHELFEFVAGRLFMLHLTRFAQKVWVPRTPDLLFKREQITAKRHDALVDEVVGRPIILLADVENRRGELYE